MDTQMKLPSDYLKQGWCQNAESCNAAGDEVDPRSPDAVSWCHSGAAFAAFVPPYVPYHSLSDNLYQKYYIALSSLLRNRTGVSVTVVNDRVYDPYTGQSQAVADAMETERLVGLR